MALPKIISLFEGMMIKANGESLTRQYSTMETFDYDISNAAGSVSKLEANVVRLYMSNTGK